MNPKNILVMQTGGWIGDMVLLTPALRALKRKLPEAQISMLVRPLVKDLMERNPYLDEVIVYDKRGTQKGIRGLRSMAKKLRSRDFDAAVVLHPTSIRSAFLAFMAGIPERVGTNLRGRELFLTEKIKHESDIHEIQRYLDIVSPIVGTDHDMTLEFWGIRKEDEDFAEAALADHSGPFIGVNPFTTWPSKQWSWEKFAHLADLLYYHFGALVILTGGVPDVQQGEEIANRISSEPLNLIGRTNLWQLAALIKRCDLYITCDSGPMHISAAVGTPTIALFGPTDPARHAPYGAGHTVVRKDTKCSPCYERKCKKRDCMNAIQVEDVMEIVKSYLA